jgi:hypothetical protein
MEPVQFDFDDGPGASIQFVRTGTNLHDRDVLVNDEVQLKKGDIRVMARVVSVRNDGAFVGEIIGYEPWHASNFQGLKEGDQVAFRLAQVCVCSSVDAGIGSTIAIGRTP